MLLTKPPLDEKFYSFNDKEAEFLKSQIGIEDDEELKRHVIAIQKKAYEVYGYSCVRYFNFVRLMVSYMPVYHSVLELSRARKDAIFLDVGCGFGNDVRKVIADGWPVHNVVATDLRQALWDFGHELFRTTPETFPVTFLAEDIFDLPGGDLPVPTACLPDVRSLTSLTPLKGHVSAIFASSFFHLFDEEQHLALARKLASLLSRLPGSVIFGKQTGLPREGYRPGKIFTKFCHSPDSWCELWDGQVFEKGTVKVEARLAKANTFRGVGSIEQDYLVWSIVRL